MFLFNITTIICHQDNGFKQLLAERLTPEFTIFTTETQNAEEKEQRRLVLGLSMCARNFSLIMITAHRKNAAIRLLRRHVNSGLELMAYGRSPQRHKDTKARFKVDWGQE